MPPPAPDHEAIARFARGLDALAPAFPLGVAVSGGPDSLALLLLAHAAQPGRVRAATVDHRVRAANADEARTVAGLCGTLRIPHDTLTADDPPPANPSQDWARSLRYTLLGNWAAGHAIGALLTAHHLDDQAETFLMRANRASGVGGLAGIRRASRMAAGTSLLRPLLGWRRSELHGIVAAAGIAAADDPTNRNPAFDRTGARALLGQAPWLRPARLAAAATHAADADAALGWSARRLWDERLRSNAPVIELDLAGVPREHVRRLVLLGLHEIRAESLGLRDGCTPRGGSVERLLRRSREDRTPAGWTATLAGVLVTVRGGTAWRFAPAPPRGGTRTERAP